jgi:hypothetical protein
VRSLWLDIFIVLFWGGVNEKGAKSGFLRRRSSIMTDGQKIQIVKLMATGNGYKRIAQQLGISPNTVKSFCRKYKADDNMQSALLGATTFCENCGREIRQIPRQKPKRFCSDKCRNAWWNGHLDQVKRKAFYTFKCVHCGRLFQVYGDRSRKYCSHECYLEERFKGGGSHG